MKQKNNIILSLIGYIISVLLFVPVTVKIMIWGSTRWYLLIFLVVVYLIPAVRRKMTVRVRSVMIICGVAITAVLSGILGGLPGSDILWLFIFGFDIGILVAMIQYYVICLSQGFETSRKKFTFFLEVALTVFSFSLYPVLLLMPFRYTSIVGMTMVIAVISFLISAVIYRVLTVMIAQYARDVATWREHDDIPRCPTELLAPLERGLNDMIKEMRQSTTSFKNMGREIKTSSEDLSSVAEQMNASLEEVSSTIQQISRGAQDQSSAITTIAGSIEHLNSLTTSISSQVKMASVSSRRTATSAQQGTDLSKHEADLSKQIFEQTTFIEEKMVRLRDQAVEIKKILDIIAGITEQTDLLALNAAIEAARVGEQGKGFAVVADEIRNLATETQQSSSIVESLILEINNTIRELGELLSSERTKMTESKELAIQTEEQFTGIAKAVDLITDMIARINDAATNQASNTKELVKQVEQIAQVAADTAASTEEVSASVQEQTASMQEFTSTSQMLAEFAMKLEKLIDKAR